MTDRASIVERLTNEAETLIEPPNGNIGGARVDAAKTMRASAALIEELVAGLERIVRADFLDIDRYPDRSACAIARALLAKVNPMAEPVVDEELVESVARALCEADGRDPNALEAGDDPYRGEPGFPSPCIDGYNRKDDPCHFAWREYDHPARAAIDAVMTTHSASKG